MLGNHVYKQLQLAFLKKFSIHFFQFLLGKIMMLTI